MRGGEVIELIMPVVLMVSAEPALTYPNHFPTLRLIEE